MRFVLQRARDVEELLPEQGEDEVGVGEEEELIRPPYVFSIGRVAPKKRKTEEEEEEARAALKQEGEEDAAERSTSVQKQRNVLHLVSVRDGQECAWRDEARRKEENG
jgi:hypothetical protein